MPPAPGSTSGGLAYRECGLWCRAGGHVADHGVAALARLGRVDGVPVHGGTVEAGEVVERDEVGGEPAPHGIPVEGDPLERGLAHEPRHGGAVVGDGDVTHAGQSVA